MEYLYIYDLFNHFRVVSYPSKYHTMTKNLSLILCGLSRVERDERRVKRFSHFYRIRVQLMNAAIGQQASETQQKQLREWR